MPSLPLFKNNMAAAAAKTVLKTVKPHVPLIKFPSRKPNPKSNHFEVITDTKRSASVASVNKISHSSTSGLPIDSSQLPLKYRRKPLTNEEIEIIEKGGRI